jgi:hypothetical protein
MGEVIKHEITTITAAIINPLPPTPLNIKYNKIIKIIYPIHVYSYKQFTDP